MLPVDFLASARRDFDESFDWYAARSGEAAVCFANSVDAALAEVARDPERCVAVDERHRACPVSRFPFRIIYRVAGQACVDRCRSSREPPTRILEASQLIAEVSRLQKKLR
jgi:plasmid stabilization system protein ParE